MSHLRTFGRFWWLFIVGDDWRLACGVVLALVGTWLFTERGVDVWWLLPICVVGLLAGSLWRETRRRPGG